MRSRWSAPVRAGSRPGDEHEDRPTSQKSLDSVLAKDPVCGGHSALGGGSGGGGAGARHAHPSLDRLADEGMTFFSFYAQPSCTPGRAAVQTGRIPNRSGMTTVAFQGRGGGLPAAE